MISGSALQTIHSWLVKARLLAAIILAFMLPVSTTGTAIYIAMFVVLALVTIEVDQWRSTLRSPAATIPIVLFLLFAAGMLWSPQPWGPGGLSHYVKLLLIPIVMATAFTPEQAIKIGFGFVAACLVLLALSYSSLLWAAGPWGWFKSPGVPVKDNAVQSTFFALCAFGLSMAAVRSWSSNKRRAVIAGALALLLFTNVFLIYLSKTGMLIAGSLLALFFVHSTGWRRSIVVAIPLAFVVLASISLSGEAQRRIAQISTDLRALDSNDPGVEATFQTASRIDFWQKAVGFIVEAPVLGHGTGSTKSLYQSLEAQRPSPYGEAVPDPHNQFLAVVIQVGLLGGALLLGMWVVHFKMFLGRGFVAVLGQGIVLQNVVGSLFNSQISQVTQGTLYCLGVGLLVGLLRRRKNANEEHARSA
jgi:O-antigen ligase